jgi:hypothetical protein
MTKRKNTGYKCRQCGGVSGEHGSAADIKHKMDCSYQYEIQMLINDIVDAVDNDLPLEQFRKRGERFYMTEW